MARLLSNGGNLTVINGGANKNVEIWHRIFIDEYYGLLSKGDTHLKKVIVAGVNYIGGIKPKEIHARQDDRTWLENKYCTFGIIVNLMGFISPAEFAVLFPPTKTYDGARYECKDYFSAMETLHRHTTVDLEFLWEYWNAKTNRFTINGVLLLDALRGYSCFEEYLKCYSKIKPRRLIKIRGHFFDEDGHYVGKAVTPKWLRRIK